MDQTPTVAPIQQIVWPDQDRRTGDTEAHDQASQVRAEAGVQQDPEERPEDIRHCKKRARRKALQAAAKRINEL